MIVKGVERKEKNEVNFKIEVDAAEFEAALHRAYLKNKKSLMIPGFRKGKAPRTVVEGMYGKNFFYEDAINDLTMPAFDFGVESEGLKPVGKPSCADMDVSDDKVLTLTFETALYPEVTLGQYKGLEAPLEKPSVADDFIDNELERLRLRNSRMITAEREARTGDTVVMDYLGTIDGVPFEGGSAEGYSLELGSGQFVPGFEDQLVGMKAGDERDIDITFPEEYHENLSGKAAVFHVKVSEVKERELPELDDEFAKDISEYDTLEEYKNILIDAEKHRLEHEAEHAYEDALIIKAIENMAADIPEAMIEERQEDIVQDYARNLAMQGLQLEQYLGIMGMDYNTFRDSARPAAQRQVQTQLLLTKVAEVESIELDDAEIEEEYKELAEKYGVEIDTVKKAIDEKGVRSDKLMKRAAEIIYESGVAIDPPPPPEKDEAEEESKTRETEE